MAFRAGPFAGTQGAAVSPRGGVGVAGPFAGGPFAGSQAAGVSPRGFAPAPAAGTPRATGFASAALNAAQLVAAATPYARQAQKKTDASMSPWGGGCPWQYDKTAFKKWLKAAIDQPKGPERKELYGFLAECFLDADADRDGFIGTEHGFNFLLDKAAAMPRRFGLAPSNHDVYGTDLEALRTVRRQMFQLMDTKGRGLIGLEQWIEFAIAHIKQKVQEINWTTIDFCNLESAGADEFIAFLNKALQAKDSEEYKSLYEFLFKTFVEADPNQSGDITSLDQMDQLIEQAASAPRALGLAPPANQTYPNAQAMRQARQALMDQMISSSKGAAGGVTFDKFLNWALSHIAVKVNESMRR